jgi:hypothetical protein
VQGFRSVGASVLIITGGIGVFLALQSVPTLRHYGTGFFSVHRGWNFDTDQVSVASLLVGTVEVALIAISLAFPLALGTAPYVSEYAPPRLQSTLGRPTGTATGDPIRRTLDDASLGAARYLCASGQDLATGEGWSASVRSYNHSDAYVREVYGAASAYAARAAS